MWISLEIHQVFQGVCYIGLQLMNDLTQLPQQLKNFSASHRSRAAGKQLKKWGVSSSNLHGWFKIIIIYIYTLSTIINDLM